MGDQAIALEVALADGTLMRTRAVRRRSTGPDLARLFVGAEGTLGVITAAALRGVRAAGAPGAARLQLRDASRTASRRSTRSRPRPAAVAARLRRGARVALAGPRVARRGAADALPRLRGLREEVDASLERARGDRRGATAAPSCRTERAQRFWDDRHVIAERFARDRARARGIGATRTSPSTTSTSRCRRRRCWRFASAATPKPTASGVGLLECGLWTAPDFFSAVFALPDAEGGHERLSESIDTLLRACSGPRRLDGVRPRRRPAAGAPDGARARRRPSTCCGGSRRRSTRRGSSTRKSSASSEPPAQRRANGAPASRPCCRAGNDAPETACASRRRSARRRCVPLRRRESVPRAR